MANTVILVPKFSDDVLIGKLKEVSDVSNPTECRARILGGQRDIDCKTLAPPEVVQKIKELASFAIQGAHVQYNGFYFSLERNLPEGKSSSSFDHVTIGIAQKGFDQASSDHLLVATSVLRKAFGVGKIFSESSPSDVETAQDWIAAGQAVTEKMQQAALALSKDLVDSRKRLDAEFSEKQSALDAQFAQRQIKLDEAHQARIETLDRKSKELDARQQELDLRDNTVVRRDIYQKVKEQIQKRYTGAAVTRKTADLRLPIHVVCLVGLLVTGGASFVYGQDLMQLATATSTQAASTTNTNLVSTTYLVVRQLGLTVGFLALLAYYIRWMNRWFDRSADADFEVRRFDLDIDRASWVVEMGLEWRKNEGGVMPSALLDSVTRNLFASTPKSEPEELHPADYLSRAILGHAKSIKASLPGVDVEMDAKDVRKDARRPS
ncbi:MAG: hypothetical protein KDK75_08165 [Alphaproteobacteria bacterium]|nr:hypothetical protein [Alphaproteobacteria bacterium]